MITYLFTIRLIGKYCFTFFPIGMYIYQDNYFAWEEYIFTSFNIDIDLMKSNLLVDLHKLGHPILLTRLGLRGEFQFLSLEDLRFRVLPPYQSEPRTIHLIKKLVYQVLEMRRWHKWSKGTYGRDEEKKRDAPYLRGVISRGVFHVGGGVLLSIFVLLPSW